jgi:transcriptional regulator with XRE-family HTH domain
VDVDRNRPAPPAGTTEGSAFGELLRRAREARGVTLEAVSDRTRIPLRHLEALERSDLAALPPGPFGKGYVRTCAKLFGVDPEPILQAYRRGERQQGVGTAEDEHRLLEQLSHLVDRSPEKKARPALSPPRPGRIALAVLLLTVLGSLGWFLVRTRPGRMAAATPPPPAPAPTEAVAAPPPTPAPSPTVRPTASPPPVRLPTDALEVPDHGVGTGLVQRRLVGRADRFAEGSHVVFWTLVVGGRPGHVIRHVWFQEGRAVMRADLPVGGPYWRTYSRLLLPQGSAGGWAVEARTSDGRLLARDEFLCEATLR